MVGGGDGIRVEEGESLRNKHFAGARVLALAAALGLSTLPAMKATPVTWLVNGFTFTDGSTISGGVTYDATSNTYSSELILATGGTLYNNVFFQYWNPSEAVSANYITLVAALPSGDLTDVPSLWIEFASPITGPPGTIVSSLLGIEGLCADSTCTTVQEGSSAFSATGEVVAFAAVPEPATGMLLPAALLILLGWKKIRRGPPGSRD